MSWGITVDFFEFLSQQDPRRAFASTSRGLQCPQAMVVVRVECGRKGPNVEAGATHRMRRCMVRTTVCNSATVKVMAVLFSGPLGKKQSNADVTVGQKSASIIIRGGGGGSNMANTGLVLGSRS